MLFTSALALFVSAHQCGRFGAPMLKRINIIKAIACSLIAMFHAFVYLDANGLGFGASFEFAAPGFHLFLLLSGFLLVHASRDDERPGTFLLKRFGRLAPLYWFMTLIAIALASWKPWILPAADLSLVSIVESLLFIPSEDALGIVMPIVFSAWTLNYLVVFYLLAAVSLPAPPVSRPWLLIALLLVFMLCAPLLPDPAASRFYESPLLLEFAAGVLIGLEMKQRAVRERLTPAVTLVLLALGIVGMYATSFSDLGDVPEVLAYSVTGALVIMGAAGRDLNGPLFKDSLLDRAGELSYGVLLIHPLVIPMIGAPLLARALDPMLAAFVLVTGMLAASFVAAQFAHRYVQSPVLAQVRQMTARARPVVAAAGKAKVS